MLLMCKFLVANVKKEPTHASELHTQILFGDVVIHVEKINEYWLQVEDVFHQFKGYVLTSQLIEIDTLQETKAIVLENKLNKNLLIGSRLYQLPPINELKYDTPIDIATDIQLQESLLLSFCGTPYMWGALTFAGIDCSGFSKIYARSIGIELPHLASAQVNFGTQVDFIQNARLGDLAFFSKNQEINHVGILLDSSRIIHASESNGCVAIDYLDHEGIVNKKTQKRTHALHSIRRL